MARGPSIRRISGRWARRSAALALAAVMQGGLLWLTAIQQHPVPFEAAETRGLPVWIVSARSLPVPRRPAPATQRPLTRTRGPSSPAAAAIATPPPRSEPSAAPGPSASAPGPVAAGAPSGVASALRGSLVGCANAAAAGLSDAERTGCRNLLAAGAATAAYRSGIPAEKRVYYDAVLAAEATFRSDAGGGHGPGVLCVPGGKGKPLPHAIKIGPCWLEPPQGMLTVDVDVPEMGSQHGALPPPR